MDTLAARVRFEQHIRRSRFVAHAAPVHSEKDAISFLDAVKDRQATHNCWAWKIHPGYRFNDDGEPSGTAGRPILSVIEGRGIDRVMIVVSRWFGGIKLGAGGLARAYSGTAARALDRVRIEPIVETANCIVEADFSLAGVVHQALEAHGAEKCEETFETDGMRLKIRLPASRVQSLRKSLQSAGRGAIQMRRLQEA